MSSHTSTLKFARIGLRIRKARVHAGLSQEAFADRIGTSRRHVMRLEKGQHRPSESMLARIAATTDTEPRDLLGEDDEEEPSTVAVTINLPQDLLDEAVRRVLRERVLS